MNDGKSYNAGSPGQYARGSLKLSTKCRQLETQKWELPKKFPFLHRWNVKRGLPSPLHNLPMRVEPLLHRFVYSLRGMLQNPKPCHSEPVTDVTGVEIRIYLQRKTDCHDQFANWSRNDGAFCNTSIPYADMDRSRASVLWTEAEQVFSPLPIGDGHGIIS